MKARYLLAGIVAVLAFAPPVVGIAADFQVPPTPDHHVTDNAGALSGSTRASLENELQAYESATGHQIVVWIGETTGGVPMETWTAETADKWKIGRRGHDDGAVLFLFMQDRKVRIEVGYGLESALTDADAFRIITEDIVPRMRANDVDGAVTSGVAAILKKVTPSYAAVSPPPAESPTGLSGDAGTFLIVAVGFFFLLLIFVIVRQVILTMRYGYLVLREGPAAARRDMRHMWGWGTGAFLGGSGSSGGGYGGGGGFSGGGSFGGGGASGGW